MTVSKTAKQPPHSTPEPNRAKTPNPWHVLLCKFHLKIRSGSTVYISDRQNSLEILGNADRFQAPYRAKLDQIGKSHGLFYDTPARETLEQALGHFSMEFGTMQSRLADTLEPGDTLEWPGFLVTANRIMGECCFGFESNGQISESFRSVFNWLFLSDNGDLESLGEEHKRRIISTSALIAKTIRGAVLNGKVAHGDNIGTDNITEKLRRLQPPLDFSDEDLIHMIFGLSLGAFAALQSYGGKLLDVFRRDQKSMALWYQAASAGDADYLERHIQLLNPMAHIPLIRIATQDYQIGRKLLPAIRIKPGDRIVLLATAKLSGELEKQAGPMEGYLRYGLEPFLVFGKKLAARTLAAAMIAVFSSRRMRRLEGNTLTLATLPDNPEAYHFELFGSSPPWAVAEEQAWLLNHCGISNHVQSNILSLFEFPRLLIKRKTSFYDPKLFYAGHDHKHHIVFGSPYGGEGDTTVRMGHQFDTFTAAIGKSYLAPAGRFATHNDFDAILQAYSTIRNNYYTLAYYSAFMDRGYRFIINALLVFKYKPGFKPLSIAGNISIIALLGLVALVQKLPFIKTKIHNYFSSTVDRNLREIRASIKTLDTLLADGRPYLFEDTFSAADIHVCATLANLIIPPEFHGGGYYPALEDYPPRYRGYIDEFRKSRAGQYVMRVYRQHRNRSAQTTPAATESQ